MFLRMLLIGLGLFAVAPTGRVQEIRANNQPAQLDIRPAGENSIRVTLKPTTFKPDFPITPTLAEREYAAPSISLREISQQIKAKVGRLKIEVLPRSNRSTKKSDSPAASWPTSCPTAG